jgi:SAM-dependent methyltransferase
VPAGGDATLRAVSEPLDPHRRDWEELATLDPLWAIASRPDKRFGGWEDEHDEFFATGQRELDAMLAPARERGLCARTDTALDFGCGVGRITRALAACYGHVVGVDIAPTMIARAEELNADLEDVEFLVSSGDDLRFLGERRFDLVFTHVVLQHQPGRAAARRYIEEFLRVLRPGGVVVFQIPVHIARRHRGLVARRLYLLLRSLGIPSRVLYERLRLHPISMLFVPESEVVRWVREAGGHVEHVEREGSARGHMSATFFVSGRSDSVT